MMKMVDGYWAETGEEGTFDEYMKKNGVRAFMKMLDTFVEKDMRGYIKRFFELYFPKLSEQSKQDLAWLFTGMVLDYDKKYGDLKEEDMFGY
jgi:hypothetical protein